MVFFLFFNGYEELIKYGIILWICWSKIPKNILIMQNYTVIIKKDIINTYLDRENDIKKIKGENSIILLLIIIIRNLILKRLNYFSNKNVI